MQNLSHLNIVNLLDCNQGEYVNSNGKVKNVIYLVMELAQGGELFDYVMSTGPFCRETCRFYFN